MTEDNRCPNCHFNLPVNAPKGLCPACLLQQGLANDETGDASQTPPGDYDQERSKSSEGGRGDGDASLGTRVAISAIMSFSRSLVVAAWGSSIWLVR